MLTKSIVRDHFLTAADCDAQFEMPEWMLAMTLVETATDHANELGVGYQRLQQSGIAWVLLRLTIEKKRPIRVHEHYRITTWVENFNRRFSERRFEIAAGADKENLEVIGYATTIWTAIDSTTRQAATLDALDALQEVCSPREDVSFERSPRVRPTDFSCDDCEENSYRVVMSDIDTNRHLTAPRYIQLMLNQWPLEQYDHNVITRFEIAYSNEARFGETLSVKSIQMVGDGENACMISRADEMLSVATIRFTPRAE